jgi:hypothetical protein
MPTLPLGKLEKIELRFAWQSEPGDFTPWLAEEANLAQLAESLGIDELELEATEKTSGRSELTSSARIQAMAIGSSSRTSSAGLTTVISASC